MSDKKRLDELFVGPQQDPTSPQAIIRSQEFNNEVINNFPLALLGRDPSTVAFTDRNFRGSTAVNIRPDATMRQLERQEPFMTKIIDELNLRDIIRAGKGLSIISKEARPSKGKPETFTAVTHEMSHQVFRQFPNLRRQVLTKNGKLRKFKNGTEIGEEDLIKILEMRAGRDEFFTAPATGEEYNSQLIFLQRSLRGRKLTKKEILNDKSVKEMLKELDRQVQSAITVPEPIRELGLR